MFKTPRGALFLQEKEIFSRDPIFSKTSEEEI
jgi:hypothetical protein